MKQMKETDKITTIVLDDGDVLEIISLRKGNNRVVVKCLDSVLHIDELSLEEIEQMQKEKEEINKMDKYLEEHGEE